MQGPEDRIVLTFTHLNSSDYHGNFYRSRFYWPHFISKRNRGSLVTKQYILNLAGQETFFCME